jgi:hypothetical protein
MRRIRKPFALAGVVGLLAVLTAGTQTAAAVSNSMAGSYRGTTSAGLPISFTIAKGENRLTKISVKETPFECPESTASGGAIRQPEGQLEPFRASKARIGPKSFVIGAKASTFIDDFGDGNDFTYQSFVLSRFLDARFKKGKFTGTLSYDWRPRGACLTGFYSQEDATVTWTARRR